MTHRKDAIEFERVARIIMEPGLSLANKNMVYMYTKWLSQAH